MGRFAVTIEGRISRNPAWQARVNYWDVGAMCLRC